MTHRPSAPDPLNELKRQAARRALEEIRPGTVVGLGTGSTARWVIEGIGHLVAGGMKITAVPTSDESEALARSCAIPICDLPSDGLDLVIDGADEYDPRGWVIKGWGGALLREKIVAAAARRYIVVVDYTKQVDQLGQRGKLPVEIVAWGWERTAHSLQPYHPALRRASNGAPFVTDGGNLILDCAIERLPDPIATQSDLKQRAGVIETGLFLGLTDLVVVAAPAGIQTIDCRRID
ncbi:MAG: ribose-5-phosphate isomerase RpiA [Herpetosiphon sp.]